MQDVLTSAEEGCFECKVVTEVVASYASGVEVGKIHLYREGNMVETFDVVLSLENEISQEYAAPLSRQAENFMRITVYGLTFPWLWAILGAETPPPVQNLEDIAGGISLARATSVAQSWMNDCSRDHQCQTGAPTVLPSRVLDLGDAESGPMLHLLEANGAAARYVTLSHCWGGQNSCKMTRDNRLELIKSIDFNLLPRTFQEAVLFTRALGVRYLWIDSLCIIQDDAEDWRRESALMHHIYKNSYLTLAASKSMNCDGGLFSTVNTDYVLRSLRVEDDDYRHHMLQSRQKIRHFESRQNFPLLQRGWVFQERILSPRILHFGPQELLWECKKSERCECSFIHTGLGAVNATGKKSLYAPPDNVDIEIKELVDRMIWRKTVEDYSLLTLTYEKDIFSALSGVAQQHKQIRGSRYFAGLWEDSIVEDLLWYTRPKRYPVPDDDRFSGPVSRPSIWRAPTWSWASVKSPIVYDRYEAFNMMLSDIECSVGLVAEETGELNDNTYLSISGYATAIALKYGTIQREAQHNHPDIYFEMDGKRIDAVRLYPDFDFWSESDQKIEDGTIVCCLLVGSAMNHFFKQNGTVYFLVLALDNGNDDEVICGKRIGLGTFDQEAFDNGKVLEFWEAFSARLRSFKVL